MRRAERIGECTSKSYRDAALEIHQVPRMHQILVSAPKVCQLQTCPNISKIIIFRSARNIRNAEVGYYSSEEPVFISPPFSKLAPRHGKCAKEKKLDNKE